MTIHKSLTLDELHGIVNYEVADATALNALVVTASDVGKVAKQASPLDFLVLTSAAPNVWTTLIAAGGGGGGGGATTLDELTDTTLATPVAGQVLTFNGTAWVNSTAPQGAVVLDDLTDTSLPAPTAGDVLTFNGTSWESTAPATGGGGGSGVWSVAEVSVSKTSSFQNQKMLQMVVSNQSVFEVMVIADVEFNNGTANEVAFYKSNYTIVGQWDENMESTAIPLDFTFTLIGGRFNSSGTGGGNTPTITVITEDSGLYATPKYVFRTEADGQSLDVTYEVLYRPIFGSTVTDLVIEEYVSSGGGGGGIA